MSSAEPRKTAAATLLGLLLSACATTGSGWMSEPLVEHAESDAPSRFQVPKARGDAQRIRRQPVRRIAEPEVAPEVTSVGSEGVALRIEAAKTEGRALGLFRNTYYHFPSEADSVAPNSPTLGAETTAVSTGVTAAATATLFDPSCKPLKTVTREFHDSLCVQGSGLLSTGVTVSFAKRDCACAEICTRTGQRICFEALSRETFPWGRGATGQAITPLLSVAVDSRVIPLHTPIYIPEYVGLPRDPQGTSVHDGCFIAQDRGLKVEQRHVDIFTGEAAMTAVWNKLVPSNQGVTVIVDSPRCRR